MLLGFYNHNILSAVSSTCLSLRKFLEPNDVLEFDCDHKFFFFIFFFIWLRFESEVHVLFSPTEYFLPSFKTHLWFMVCV